MVLVAERLRQVPLHEANMEEGFAYSWYQAGNLPQKGRNPTA